MQELLDKFRSFAVLKQYFLKKVNKAEQIKLFHPATIVCYVYIKGKMNGVAALDNTSRQQM